ncbi:ABC transporter substrate-binding protein [Crateriforma conspicua]|uniref:Leucine-binding protein domain-containing protein n=1 Tax=Crateriforma conspicua TaxID=2527996 RepID=A0A5C6FP63_9PLAN|nr:ABC transporter substrate-binding protein [Crateriforma conspicua]TWU61881.1 hypothetical protein V7x_35710 [Crateriforma conspicua]
MNQFLSAIGCAAAIVCLALAGCDSSSDSVANSHDAAAIGSPGPGLTLPIERTSNRSRGRSARSTTTPWSGSDRQSEAGFQDADAVAASSPVRERVPRILIGLDADMSSASARSGEAIRRGIVLAIDRINHDGGLLGRQVELLVCDHRGNPARGIDNIRDLAANPDVVAVVGGIHTPVALEELSVIHDVELPYLGPWAAGTPLVANGYEPNFVFRVSVRDQFAGEFLVRNAVQDDKTQIALVLESTGWGRSNEVAMRQALDERELQPTTVQWFHWGEPSFRMQIDAIRSSGAEVVLLVANPLEGIRFVQQMAQVPAEDRIPILSHWGITGGNFADQVGDDLNRVDLRFLQSYSFLSADLTDTARSVVAAYCRTFDDADSARDIFAPTGTAHAYEVVMMLAQAIRQAGTVDRLEVRAALERLKNYNGLIRNFQRPFTVTDHDALTIDDLHLARFDEAGVIVPLGPN